MSQPKLERLNLKGLTAVEVLHTDTLCSYFDCPNEGTIVYEDFSGVGKLCEDCYEGVLNDVADRGRD